MGLLGNGSVLNKDNGFCTSGTGAQSGHAGNYHKSGRYRNRHWFIPKQSSTPEGYHPPESYRWPQKDGGLGSQQQMSGAISLTTSSLVSGINIISSFSGSISITNAQLDQIVRMIAALSGTGTITNAAIAAVSQLLADLSASLSTTNANAVGLAYLLSSMSASISLTNAADFATAQISSDIGGATPLSPEGLAQSLLDDNDVETTYSVRESLRLILSALVGKVSGAAGTTVTIRDVNDTVDRIVATVDSSGNRTAVTKDVT